MQKSQWAHDLLLIADELVAADAPRQANLKRAVSTTYYALFHCLSQACAQCLMGPGDKNKAAWRQTYRALQHGFAKKACNIRENKQRTVLEKFPVEIQDFANQFYSMQIKRHNADYDPYVEFERSQVLTDITTSREVIRTFEEADLDHIRAFAAWVLFIPRD